MLDTIVTAETPEGILLELRPAGVSSRFYAFALDWLIRLVVIYVAAFITRIMGGIGVAFWVILFFLLEWFYPVVFELGRSGSTPGKQVFGLRVVMDSGLPVTPAASFTRNLLRVADFLPLAYGFAIISMLLRTDGKRLGDIAAATLVVYRPLVPHGVALDGIVPIPPKQSLRPAEQAAIIALASRTHTLTAARLDELAALASTVSGNDGHTGAEVTRRVLGVAKWLLGQRQ